MPPIPYPRTAGPDPSSSRDPSAAPNLDGSAAAAAGRRTVLLVEDDPSSAHALTLLLRRFGWTVDVASTLAEANAYLNDHRPSSVILDLMLPDGEGSAILERVRAARLDVRVTVTTASADPDRLQRVRSLRPDALLHKPLDLAELLRVL